MKMSLTLRQQFGDCAREVARMWGIGAVFPRQIKRQLDVEEMQTKLHVICGELYDVALEWVAWRQTWHEPFERDWLDAARDEYEHAIRYGPHDVGPHPDKMPSRKRT